jgi:hypothetical protein
VPSLAQPQSQMGTTAQVAAQEAQSTQIQSGQGFSRSREDAQRFALLQLLGGMSATPMSPGGVLATSSYDVG